MPIIYIFITPFFFISLNLDLCFLDAYLMLAILLNKTLFISDLTLISALIACVNTEGLSCILKTASPSQSQIQRQLELSEQPKHIICYGTITLFPDK